MLRGQIAEWGVTALQEKARLKKEKEEAEAKYKYALVDGRKEQVLTLPSSWRGPTRGVHGCCEGISH